MQYCVRYDTKNLRDGISETGLTRQQNGDDSPRQQCTSIGLKKSKKDERQATNANKKLNLQNSWVSSPLLTVCWLKGRKVREFYKPTRINAKYRQTMLTFHASSKSTGN